MALGNLAYAQQQPQQAIEHFLKAVKLFPQAPEGWNNLAYALSANGCPETAGKARGCASALAPDRFKNKADSLPGPIQNATQQCPAIPQCPAEALSTGSGRISEQRNILSRHLQLPVEMCGP